MRLSLPFLLFVGLIGGSIVPTAAQNPTRSGQSVDWETFSQSRNVGCAGNELLTEGFEGGALPADWVVLDNDGGTPNSNIQFITESGGWQVRSDLREGNSDNQVLVSPSWYDNDTLPSDDWLILAQTAPLPNQTCFSFLAYAQDPSYPESFEVRISTTGQAPADFLTQAPLLSVAAESAVLSHYTLDLSDYAGQSVFLAIRHTSVNAFLLVLDEIRLTDVAQGDLAVFDFEGLPNNAESGVDYPIIGSLVNRGLDTLSFDSAEAVVGYETVGNIYRDRLDFAFQLGPNDTLRFTHSRFWEPPSEGLFGFNLFVEPIDGDPNRDNDTLYTLLPVGVTLHVPEPIPADLGWSLSPNPVRDQAQLTWRQATTVNGTLQVLDIRGKQVLAPIYIPAGTRTWDLSLLPLPQGSYLLQYQNGQGQSLQLTLLRS